MWPAVISGCESPGHAEPLRLQSQELRSPISGLSPIDSDTGIGLMRGRVREHPRSEEMGQARAKGRSDWFSLGGWGQRMEDGTIGSAPELDLPPSSTWQDVARGRQTSNQGASTAMDLFPARKLV